MSPDTDVVSRDTPLKGVVNANAHAPIHSRVSFLSSGRVPIQHGLVQAPPTGLR